MSEQKPIMQGPATIILRREDGSEVVLAEGAEMLVTGRTYETRIQMRDDGVEVATVNTAPMRMEMRMLGQTFAGEERPVREPPLAPYVRLADGVTVQAGQWYEADCGAWDSIVGLEEVPAGDDDWGWLHYVGEYDEGGPYEVVDSGDWIVIAPDGDTTVCDQEDFAKEYRPVEMARSDA